MSGMACGEFHCLAFTDKGRIFSWGKATEGALGFELPEQITYINEPRQIDSLLNYEICQVSCGSKHSLCLTTCGKVFNWGTGDKDIKAGVSYHEPRNVFDMNQTENKDEFIMICAG